MSDIEPDNQTTGVARARPAALPGTDLHGDLLCARCRYNLRGLSITGTCPECGTPVRATLLAVVDPLAHELRPIPHPVLTARGLLLWSICALLATLVVWGLRCVEMFPGVRWSLPGAVMVWGPRMVVFFAALSGVGAIAMVKPHAGIARRSIALAALGCVLYPLLCVQLWMLHGVLDASLSMSPFGSMNPMERPLLRLSIDFLIVTITLSLRPSARLLASRSYVMREGRVDRQTLAALAAVLVLPIVADLILLVPSVAAGSVIDMLNLLAQLLSLLGFVLFTLGLVGVVIDTIRLQGVILEAPLSLRELLTPPGDSGGGAGNTGGSAGPSTRAPAHPSAP